MGKSLSCGGPDDRSSSAVHPNLVALDRYANAVTTLRSMVESIMLTPENGTLRVVVTGGLAVMLAAGYPKHHQAAQREQLSLVAGGGFEPPTFGL
jgi:hypothetical protein